MIMKYEDDDDSTETIGGWDNIQLRPFVLWIYQHNSNFQTAFMNLPSMARRLSDMSLK